MTSVAVAERFFDAPSVLGVATDAAFPDPLTGSTHIATLGGPLLLSDPDGLPDAVASYFAAVAADLTGVTVYGGPAALSEDVVDAIRVPVRAALDG